MAAGFDRDLRHEIASFAREELSPGTEERDRDKVFSRDLWKKCGSQRLQGMIVPEEYGGLGLDPVSAVAALEGLGFGCRDGGLSFAICAHLLACVVPILKHGSENMKRRYLPNLSDGTLVAANAMTEPGTGSDAFALITRADETSNGYRINGRKTFVSNGPVADVIVTYAGSGRPGDPARSVTAFAVPANTPGVVKGRRIEKMGLHTSLMCEIVFEDAVVGHDAVIGAPGAGAQIFAQSMDWERACLVAVHVGTMERILADLVSHARKPQGSGEPPGRRQAVAHRLADMKVRIEGARMLTREAARSLAARHASGMAPSIAKLYGSEALVQSAADAVQILAECGIASGSDAERTLRDAVASTIYSGTSDIQRNIIARWLGLQP